MAMWWESVLSNPEIYHRSTPVQILEAKIAEAMFHTAIFVHKAEYNGVLTNVGTNTKKQY